MRGTVTSVREYGVFVRLDAGPTALLHVDNISEESLPKVLVLLMPFTLPLPFIFSLIEIPFILRKEFYGSDYSVDS